MKMNPVGWFEIYVKDLPRAKKFYETVLEKKLEPLEAGPEVKMMAFPMEKDASGATGALVKMEGYQPSGNGVIVYFVSDDCSKEEKRVTAAGGKVQKPKMAIGKYGFISLAVDTEGNIFGIHSMS